MHRFMEHATVFDSNLSAWDTSQLSDVSYMFYWVSNFSGNGVEKWNVSNVVNMAAMFSSCDSFNADLSNWDVSQVKNMTHAFLLTR
jgi:trimeric autotransporter adhesin